MNNKTALRIVLGYAVLAGLWIVLSDFVLYSVLPSVGSMPGAEILKGLFFVAVTTAVLYALLRKIRQTEGDRYRAVFENHHAPMLLINPADGVILDANPAATDFYGWSRERLRSMRMTDINILAPAEIKAEKARAQSAERRTFHFRHRRADGGVRDVEVFSGPVLMHGRALLFLIIYDETERNAAALLMQRQKDLYAAISEINAALLRLPAAAEIYAAACQIAVKRVGFLFAWVGEIDPQSATIRLAAKYGNDQGYLDQLHITMDATQPLGQGPTAQAVHSGQPSISNDFLNDPATQPWHEAGQRIGVRASGAFPVFCEGRVVAVLTAYSGTAGFFDRESQELLREMARDISFALDNDLRQRRLAENITEQQRMLRELAGQEERFRALAEQSLVGIYMVDDGFISYANPRASAVFGYGEQEFLGLRIPDIVAAEDLPRVQENVRRRMSGETTSMQYEFRGRRKDGSTVMIGVHGNVATIGGKRVIIGVMQDITDKMKVEAEIREYITRMEHTVLGAVDAMSTMVELRDPYTSGHERRVGEMAAAIAAEMGFDELFQRGLRIAGAVHDVGKIAVPAEILSKPGRLTAIEMEMVKEHAAQGYEVLKTIDFPWPVAEVARQHHERIDGSGYPRGLRGEDIIIEARILAVADVVESMATHRPYRPSLGVDVALAEIETNAGRLYDARAAAACLRLFRERGYTMPP